VKYHFTSFKSLRSLQEERERERERNRNIKDIYVAFSDLSRPEIKPGDLSGGPRKIWTGRKRSRRTGANQWMD